MKARCNGGPVTVRIQISGKDAAGAFHAIVDVLRRTNRLRKRNGCDLVIYEVETVTETAAAATAAEG